MQTLFTLGRQPKLGLAELESLYGAAALQPFGVTSTFVNTPVERVPFARLGGSTRACRVLAELPSTAWPSIRDYLIKTIPEHEQYVPDGKLTVGLSVIGLKVNTKELERTLLTAKKAVKSLGRSMRIVPNKTQELNAAQIIHNNLLGTNGWELVVVSDGKKAYLCQTVFVQDIEAYAARDQARPYRDAKVGMLPPKLAQTIINLACATTQPAPGIVVLDPFCGTGVVLQEASLMGFDVYGTDIDPRMIEYSISNMHWLREKFDVTGEYVRIELGDATKHTWQKTPTIVAGETYLGKPLATLPPSDQLSKVMYEANLINHRFLQHIAPQLPRGTRLCMAMPAWRGKHEFLHLSALDHLQELGYTRVKFVHVQNDDLIYHRDNQVVARELVVLVKE